LFDIWEVLRLQRLEITGFKSFADHTEIIFSGEGITAIVGPNGCGKSNISEAILWVLGERAKELRGNEMQDLIFQGTNKRSPSSMAEVCLHLVCSSQDHLSQELGKLDKSLQEPDETTIAEMRETKHKPNEKFGNGSTSTEKDAFLSLTRTDIQEEFARIESERKIPSEIEIQKRLKLKRRWKPHLAISSLGETISITRRLFRSGESEYLINGKPCRLRDIQDLFAGTGLSGTKYAIIEQGQIGQILSAKPTERRALIEEVAGVSRFRIRQKAVEVRLETARMNLSRINDIIGEVEKQVTSLKRQASKAERYRKLKEDLRLSLRKIFAVEGNLLLGKIERTESEIANFINQENQISSRIREKEDSFHQVKRRLSIVEEDLNQLRASYTEKLLQQSRFSRDLEHKREQIEVLKTRVKKIQAEINEAEARLKILENEAKALQDQEQQIKSQIQEIGLKQVEDSYKAVLGEIESLDCLQKEIQNKKSKHLVALERFNEAIRQNQNLVERLFERLEGLKREGERAERNFNEHFSEYQKLQKELESLRPKLNLLQADRKLLYERTEEAKKNVTNLERELKEFQEKLSQNKHRLEGLKEIESKGIIYSSAVQRIFAEQGKIGIKLLGTLADKLNVNAEHERAVESIFGDFLQTILVGSEKEASALIEYLSKNHLGRVSILCIQQSGRNEKIEKKHENSRAETKILDVLGIDENLAQVLREVFERETSAELVEDLWQKESSGLGASVLINQNGDLMIAGKLFVVGKSRNEDSSSLLRFKRKLKSLEEENSNLLKKIAEKSEQVELARSALYEEQEKLSHLETLKQELEKTILSKEIQAESLSREIERTQRHKKVVADEMKQSEEEIKQLKEKQKSLKVNSENVQRAIAEADSELNGLNKKFVKLKVELEKWTAELNRKKTEIQVTEEKHRQVVSVLKRVENEKVELQRRILNLETEVKQSARKIETLTQEIIYLENSIEATDKTSSEEQKAIKTFSEELKNLREQEAELERELSELNKSLSEIRSNRTKIEIEKAEATVSLKNLSENCHQQLGEPLAKIIEDCDENVDSERMHKDLEQMRKNADEINAKIESLGAVNMLAVEDLSQAEQRLNFLLEQKADLLKSISDAEEALEEIKKRSQQKFLEAFEAINENFKRIFKELFSGGSGEMRLIGDSNQEVFESGIEIIAQPPGKRLQNVLLLSGGEKAMVALALTLAIFEYRPSPFCVLDEVDASLDDASIDRFVEKLKQMASGTQFIVITHNKKTMEAAQVLYGVTMQERGISKVVSVKLV
jgi:chromosome segregation protein